jgi:transcription-repair coupling factor (superfamily II helicase)
VSASPLVAEYARAEEMALARRVLERPGGELGGFWGASLAFFLAAWKRGAGPERAGPCLVITASQEEADEVQDEIEAFAEAPVLEFPAWESLFLPDSVPDGGTFQQRVLVADWLVRRPGGGAFIIAPAQAVLQPVPSRDALAASRLLFREGEACPPLALAENLLRAGYRHVPLVQGRGEFSSRGDIFDLFPHASEGPIRLELFGDVIESVREFEAETQRSRPGARKGEAEVLVLRTSDVFRDVSPGDAPLLLDLLDDGAPVFVKEPEAVLERSEKVLGSRLGESSAEALVRFRERLEARIARVRSLPAGEEGGLTLRFSSVERFRGGDLDQVFSGIADRLRAGYRIEVHCENDAEAKRLLEIAADHGLAGVASLSARAGPVRRGFEVSALRAIVLTTREIFNRHTIRRVRAKVRKGRPIETFLELEAGDHVVHLAHGIGRYLGMESFEKNEVLQEFLGIEFRDRVKVYVPVSKIDLVQKYIGGGDRQPILDKVGGTSWARRKEEVETALFDLASDLIEIQALRRERPGFPYPADSDWQREFEAAFPYEETPDQTDINQAIKADMESPRPMDRLVCGDVGYGKTELAMRSVFKAVHAGKQAAVLVPTTVLAQQHFRTFSERMAGFPVQIDMLSRFRTPAEQRETVRAAAEGRVDVLIGTHRLLSGDVAFKDLGLVIIDEEQRFGVAHKEKLKRMRSTVDVLTLTATPIPRTLHMSLLGIRDISSLTTAPEGRSAVRTEVSRFDPRRVREVILRELDRDGQVYFVHNRIHDIDLITHQLERIVPEARIEYAHGQMDEHELEDKMVRFFERAFDVLVSTTIIENGLDIPNVNTIFIDEADRYGLADLHQLRGRVGRYKHQAYCYLLLPEHRRVEPEAQKRVQALIEFSDLGSGFKIAMRDLEIRGAGNILGPEQSGHIAAVGYDMYCRLLEKAVRRLHKDTSADPVQVEVDLEIEAFIPVGYLEGEAAKLDVYRRISVAGTLEAVDDMARELADRFGPVPPEIGRLLDVQRLRVLCAAAGIEHVGRSDDSLILKGEGDGVRALLDGCPARIAILDQRTAAVSLSDPRRRHGPPADDTRAFAVVLEWLRTGVFPRPGLRAGERVEKARGIPAGGV